MSYGSKIADQLWAFAEKQGRKAPGLLESRRINQSIRPPVYRKEHKNQNLISPPSLVDSDEFLQSLVEGIKLHHWFRSAKSSQALTISVFRNLELMGKLPVLGQVENHEGARPFQQTDSTGGSVMLEYEIKGLMGEPQPTSVDVFLSGDPQIFVECKFTEAEIGPCGMPNGTKERPAQCNGDYSIKKSSKFRCPLTKKGVKYWDFLPKFTNIENDRDYIPCPIRHNYQLIRNSLVAGLKRGRVVLVYDARNPQFMDGGDAMIAFQSCKNILKSRDKLLRVSWQEITSTLSMVAETKWLADALTEKYGF